MILISIVVHHAMLFSHLLLLGVNMFFELSTNILQEFAANIELHNHNIFTDSRFLYLPNHPTNPNSSPNYSIY